MTRSGRPCGIERPFVGEQGHDRRVGARRGRAERANAPAIATSRRASRRRGPRRGSASSRRGRAHERTRPGRPAGPPRQLGDQDRQRAHESAGRRGAVSRGQDPLEQHAGRPRPVPAGTAGGRRPGPTSTSHAIASRPATIQPVSIRRRTSARWTKASAPGPARRRESPGGPAGQEPIPLGGPPPRPRTSAGEISPRHRATVWNRSVRSEPQARASAIASSHGPAARTGPPRTPS